MEDEAPRRDRWFSFDALLRALVLTAAACIIIASLKASAAVLAPLMIALFVTAVVAAPVLWLTHLRLPYWAAVGLVVTFTAGSLVGLIFLSLHWQEALAQRMPLYRTEASALLLTAQDWLTELGLDITLSNVMDSWRTEWLLPAGARTVRVLSVAVFVLVLTGFLLAEFAALPIKLQAAFGAGNKRVAAAGHAAEQLLGYFRIKAATSFATGVLAGVSCALVGVDFPVLWGLIAFLFNFAPTVGSLVAAVPPVALAWVVLGWKEAAILGGAYAAINLIIGAILEPKFLGDRMDLAPLTVLLSLLLWGWVWGAVGVILAVPLTMVIKNIMERTVGLRPVAILFGSARAAQMVNERVRKAEQPPWALQVPPQIPNARPEPSAKPTPDRD